MKRALTKFVGFGAALVLLVKLRHRDRRKKSNAIPAKTKKAV